MRLTITSTKIKETLRLVDVRCIGSFEWDATVGCYMKGLASLRRERERQPIISKCIEEMRQELKKYEYFQPANQRIDDVFDVIEKVLGKHTHTHKRQKAETLRAARKKLEIMDLDLPEKIYEIIYGEYNISRDWCPRFFNSCKMILVYSEMIRDELVKRGSSVDEDDVITFECIYHDSE